ncbi:esterase-like activity of phytase, partial [Escherichia coli O157]|nr:esterase-like activity of phytase [Escherichia coli O157]
MKDFIKRYKKNLIILVFIIAAISFVNLSTSYEMSDDSYILNIKKEFLNINNLSSLTYSPHDGYLYATVNKPAKLLIISTGGAMRQIKNMPFIKDAES